MGVKAFDFIVTNEEDMKHVAFMRNSVRVERLIDFPHILRNNFGFLDTPNGKQLDIF